MIMMMIMTVTRMMIRETHIKQYHGALPITLHNTILAYESFIMFLT